MNGLNEINALNNRAVEDAIAKKILAQHKPSEGNGLNSNVADEAVKRALEKQKEAAQKKQEEHSAEARCKAEASRNIQPGVLSPFVKRALREVLADDTVSPVLRAGVKAELDLDQKRVDDETKAPWVNLVQYGIGVSAVLHSPEAPPLARLKAYEVLDYAKGLRNPTTLEAELIRRLEEAITHIRENAHPEHV